MKLKELIDAMAYRTHYKLIGANTGKHLADSITNKAGYLNAFLEDDVSGFFPSYNVQTNTITRTPERISPIICIWVSGR